MITKESIEQKLAGLKQQYAQLSNNANAVGGAIQLCEQLLQEIEANAVIDGEKV